MRLDPNYVLQPIADEWVLVPTGDASEKFRGIVRLNSSALFIVKQLAEPTDEATIVAAMLEEYEVDEERATKAVARTIASLREAFAIID